MKIHHYPDGPTWDEFLPHFRRGVRLICSDEFTEADKMRLSQLGQNLVQELKNSQRKRPRATKTQIIEELRECLNEMPHAETMLRHKLTALKTTPDLYDARYPLIREAIATAEDTLGGLIALLVTYYPKTLAGAIHTNKGLLPVRELVREYLPGWHKLNKETRNGQADPPTATPPPEAAAPAEPFASLLLNYTLSDLTALLKELGLLNEAGSAAPVASPGAWVGVVYGLIEAEPPRLKNNMAAARRAFVKVFSAEVSESSINKGLGKKGSEAEQFRDATWAYLN